MSQHQPSANLILSRIKSSLPSLFLLLSFLSLISGLIGIAFIQQQPETSNFDIRQQASTEFDANLQLTSPEADKKLLIDPNQKTKISFTISQTQFDTTEVVFFVSSKVVQNPEVKVGNSNFNLLQSEIEQTKDGYAISTIIQHKSDATTSRTGQSLLEFEFTPSSADSIFVSFDTERTFAFFNKEKQSINAPSFTVGLTSNNPASPSPSPSPSVSPTPSISPSPNPSPSPNNTVTLKSCNQNCSAHSECQANHLCYNTGNGNVCRLATNPSNSSCSVTTDAGLNRQCNQYCSNNSECSSGLSCWYNRCRRPDNIESTTCSRPSSTTQQAIVQSCNGSCSSNRECPINMRCYNSQCRLASNPSSTSCSAVTTPTVSNEYDGTKGGSATDSANASDSASIEPTFMPIASPIIDSEVPIGSDVDSEDTSTLGRLRAYIAANTRLLALGLLVLGMVLLLLFLLVTVIRTFRRRPPQKPPAGELSTANLQGSNREASTRPQFSSTLEEKINTKAVEPLAPRPETALKPAPPLAASIPTPLPVSSSKPEFKTQVPPIQKPPISIPPQPVPEIKPATAPIAMPPVPAASPVVPANLAPQQPTRAPEVVNVPPQTPVTPQPTATPNPPAPREIPVVEQKPPSSMLSRIQQKNISLPQAKPIEPPANTTPPLAAANNDPKPVSGMLKRIQDKNIKIG